MSADANKSTDGVSLAPGQLIFEYRIDKVLGCGGFGLTYLAQDLNLQLPVAIKEYFPSSLAVRSADQSVHVRSSEAQAQFDWGLERFIDEARTLASFRHPHIVRVLRYFKQNGTAYIVMEYESGEPLKQWLGQQGSLDQTGLLQIVYPILNGLEAVHKLNFLHRDIKPDNIYIRADGTPVLLDFGAARRVSQDQEMTNIVSPGFAPFEQYHSNGNQGPWTDLYSLGAVMYWMTTGRKPVEAAARVREDTMPKAIDQGNRSLFGQELLQAIDWALTPHELGRPQNVAALRQALMQSEQGRTQLQNTRLLERKESVHPDFSRVLTVPSEDTLRKNVMGSIMFLDLVAYSKHSVDQQVAIKTLFNELITKAIGGVDANSRIMLDTGDGAAICFLGDPEEALRSALLMRDLLAQKYQHKLSMRVGLHLGPVRMLMDINNRVNVVGDGINVAQRIMDFSAANQIMVSRAFYDVISRISDGGEAMFEFLGTRLDKHQRAHEVYALADAGAVRNSPVMQFAPVPSSQTVGEQQRISAEDLRSIEFDLTQAIGPLAHVLVKKSVARSANAADLRERLSVSIQDPGARESFVHPKSVGKSQTAPYVSGTSSRRLNTDLPAHTTLASATASQHSRTLSEPMNPTVRVSTLDAAQQALLERALGSHIGPLAKTLVRKESARAADYEALVQALARHIDEPQDRIKFLAVVRKPAA